MNDSGSSLVIIGPKVRTLWQVNLPYEPDIAKLWREHSITERVEVVIEFQGRISDDDLAELRRLREQFDKVMDHVNHGIDHMGRDGDEHVRRFGFVRLPDFRSPSSSVFVSDNVDARVKLPALAVDPDGVRQIVRNIYRVVDAYCKKDMKAGEEAAHSSIPELAR